MALDIPTPVLPHETNFVDCHSWQLRPLNGRHWLGKQVLEALSY